MTGSLQMDCEKLIEISITFEKSTLICGYIRIFIKSALFYLKELFEKPFTID